MAKYTTVDVNPESKSEKKIRIFLAVMFFIQTVLTTFPFIHGNVQINGLEGNAYLTAFELLVQKNGYQGEDALLFAVLGGLLVLLPMAGFFCCLLDKKSRVKWAVSAACSVICAVVITFAFGKMIDIAAVMTLIINVVTLFMTMQGVQATGIRNYTAKKS